MRRPQVGQPMGGRARRVIASAAPAGSGSVSAAPVWTAQRCRGARGRRRASQTWPRGSATRPARRAGGEGSGVDAGVAVRVELGDEVGTGLVQGGTARIAGR